MELQEAFDATAKILFGQEIGKLGDFAPYLSEMMLPCSTQKSFISGKEVMLGSHLYPDGARFISQDEVGQLKFPPLNVNEIKDIDSLFSAVSERVVYCGSKLFGRNRQVSEVDNCVDSAFVQHSHNVFNVKYAAYCSVTRDGEHIFGVTGYPGANFAIRTMEGVNASRTFETYYGKDLSETYFVFNCIGCQSCMFSFNLRSKRHVIGNLELPREQYAALRQKLAAEMGEELRKNKRLFSIADLAFFGRDRGKLPEEKIAFDSPIPPRVDDAFSATTGIVLGKKRQGIRGFGPWLLQRTLAIKKVKGALGSPTFKVDLPICRELPADRLVTLKEGMEFSCKNRIAIKPGESLPLKEALARASKIAYFSMEFVDGQNENCVDTPSIYTGSNVYKLWDVTNGKYSAYATASVESEHIFGGYMRILSSQFCINCFDSTSIRGCFEVDSSYSTRDSYLCHNVENCDNCILCFNAKSLRYAVGNAEVGKEEFLRIKKMLLDYINGGLDSKKSVDLGVFSLPKVVKSRG